MQNNKLEQLKSLSTVVADTGDIEAIKRFSPIDATTNPSLILQAAQLPQYRELLQQSLSWGKQNSGSDQEFLSNSAEHLGVSIGLEILKIIPGRISTEVDARLSFNTQATLDKAREIVAMYNQAGIPNERLLIKIASTWEGIRAAQILEKEGIQCNLTLLFSLAQAVACADAGVYLISPFVGRILDWYKAKTGTEHYPIEQDPGVQSVSAIFNYYKQHGYQTIVMGASFRSTAQVEQLAGCDRLTISPTLLQQLEADQGELPIKLDQNNLLGHMNKLPADENAFRWSLNDNAMATEKLSEGIRNFASDQGKLERYLHSVSQV